MFLVSRIGLNVCNHMVIGPISMIQTTTGNKNLYIFLYAVHRQKRDVSAARAAPLLQTLLMTARRPGNISFFPSAVFRV